MLAFDLHGWPATTQVSHPPGIYQYYTWQFWVNPEGEGWGIYPELSSVLLVNAWGWFIYNEDLQCLPRTCVQPPLGIADISPSSVQPHYCKGTSGSKCIHLVQWCNLQLVLWASLWWPVCLNTPYTQLVNQGKLVKVQLLSLLTHCEKKCLCPYSPSTKRWLMHEKSQWIVSLVEYAATCYWSKVLPP